MLSPSLHKQVFPKSLLQATSEHIQLAQKHLETHQLWGKTSKDIANIEFELPKLLGPDIAHHFKVLGKEQQQEFGDQAEKLASCIIPKQPKVWSRNEGWTRYSEDGTASSIDTPPPGESLVFDVEVLYKISPYPVMATACSSEAWYSWTMPGFFNQNNTIPNQLIPFGYPNQKRLVVGHFVAFDRARILEEYSIKASNLGFIDTLSLHSAISGLSTQQRLSWVKYQKDKKTEPLTEDLTSKQKDFMAFQEENEPSLDQESRKKSWEDFGSTNSLDKVAELHLNKKIDKTQRDEFATTDIKYLSEPEKFQELMNYCAADVMTTFELFQVIFPKFQQKCPHPVSFAGMMHMGKAFLTTNQNWDNYINTCETMTQKYISEIEESLKTLADNALKLFEDKSYQNDPWLCNLDWTVKPVKMTKEVVSKKGIIKPSRPYANSNLDLQGKPQWYRDLWDIKLKKIRISASKKVVPYLLKLEWNKFPVFYDPHFGWMYHGPSNMIGTRAGELPITPEKSITGHVYYRIPHPSGDYKNCGNPLAKSFIKAFETETLTSSYPAAKNLLKINSYCIFWISARARVKSQFVVWEKENTAVNGRSDKTGIIIPQTAVMGTVTRRATDATWMTAPNAKENRIGSELKAKIVAPPGYKIVGADVDSEELWIASLLGDKQFGIHGASAIGFMTLQGTKSAGTDLHSTSGRIVGISRDVAKIFNYSRIYGAGQNHAAKLLLQHNPGLEKTVAMKKASDLYVQTKGAKIRDYKRIFGSDHVWCGGSESFMFNCLEKIASSADTRTPALGCQIPDTLSSKNVNEMFKTSRINWVVQSSGVDYLHLLLVSMDYLMRRMRIDGRYLLSIHDEVRYLVREQDANKAALALQISNLWTRCLFSLQVGIHDLPLNVAFFSAVDVDNVLRKEVDMNCLTPSNPTPVPPGRSLDISQILELLEDPKLYYGSELRSMDNLALSSIEEKMSDLTELSTSSFIKAQMAKSSDEFKRILGKNQSAKISQNIRKVGTFSKEC